MCHLSISTQYLTAATSHLFLFNKQKKLLQLLLYLLLLLLYKCIKCVFTRRFSRAHKLNCSNCLNYDFFSLQNNVAKASYLLSFKIRSLKQTAMDEQHLQSKKSRATEEANLFLVCWCFSSRTAALCFHQQVFPRSQN